MAHTFYEKERIGRVLFTGAGGAYLTLGAKTMPLQVYYYLYQGNWFDTAVAATLMTIPVLILSAFLQSYLRETSLAGVMR